MMSAPGLCELMGTAVGCVVVVVVVVVVVDGPDDAKDGTGNEAGAGELLNAGPAHR